MLITPEDFKSLDENPWTAKKSSEELLSIAIEWEESAQMRGLPEQWRNERLGNAAFFLSVAARRESLP